MVIFLNLVLAGLRLSLKNYQVGEKWIVDDYLYLCKSLNLSKKNIFPYGYQFFIKVNSMPCPCS
ncbi:hypothetical protein THERMOS_665 [Bathymodiolus thermophilus thioautotrophic gill symbiont]|uniref:Uncharacterized protein n=1 Tax=Bathymodiolus thermophilus thioautotrophic gill symbiont TaxID=2360 RepID=A0A8H8XB15_9GAMM|nr:hypothetical protein THERMOS_665 [Bathymodiolus thermophilus thioautotrophic gill symbiont]